MVLSPGQASQCSTWPRGVAPPRIPEQCEQEPEADPSPQSGCGSVQAHGPRHRRPLEQIPEGADSVPSPTTWPRGAPAPGIVMGHPRTQPVTSFTIWSFWHDPAELYCDRSIVGLCRANLIRYNPDCDVRFLSVADFLALETVPESEKRFFRTYVQLDTVCMAKQADFIRLCLLAYLGGVWIDASSFCLRPLADLGILPDKVLFFRKTGRPHSSRGDSVFRAHYPVLENWFLASPTPHHPFLKAWLAEFKVHFQYFHHFGCVVGKRRYLARLARESVNFDSIAPEQTVVGDAVRIADGGAAGNHAVGVEDAADHSVPVPDVDPGKTLYFAQHIAAQAVLQRQKLDSVDRAYDVSNTLDVRSDSKPRALSAAAWVPFPEGASAEGAAAAARVAWALHAEKLVRAVMEDCGDGGLGNVLQDGARERVVFLKLISRERAWLDQALREIAAGQRARPDKGSLFVGYLGGDYV